MPPKHSLGTNSLPRRLAHSYSALARGLFAPSESFYPYKPFSAAFGPDQELTPETFRAALNLASFWDIYPNERDKYGDTAGDEWFANLIADCRDGKGVGCPEDAIVYEHLQRTMQATLNGPLENWVVTARNKNYDWFYYTRRYVFGRVKNGGLAGLLALYVYT